MAIIATAAWAIPKDVADRFPAEGSGLARYAAVFRGVEINSTFYRHHKASTFARWSDSVPVDFRFAVKIPKEITHVRRLIDIDEVFSSFIDALAPLGHKLGPLLCQLPPSLAFEQDEAERAFETMRDVHAKPIVIEVRHKSWASDQALALLERYDIGRVLADPERVWPARSFSGPAPYVRLHGSPKVYYSSYTDEDIRAFARYVADDGWCVFDNTASGAACANALSMMTDVH